MVQKKEHPVIQQVLTEQRQGHPTRKRLFIELEKLLGRPVVSFFTSFRYPVMIEDNDADMLEGILQKMDLTNGLALVINSPGGDGLAAERIINICRNYSKTNEYWAIIPAKAKSAATMISFGASKIIMSKTSELGPIDPQLILQEENGLSKRFSAVNVVESYNDLFKRAVNEKGNLQPYLQQLANYDERDIKEIKAVISLAEDIAIRTLKSGMMKGKKETEIKKEIELFLSPKRTKTHGRAISMNEGLDCCLFIEQQDLNSDLWKLLYELYIRTNTYVSTMAAKCIESSEHSFFAAVGRKGENEEDES